MTRHYVFFLDSDLFSGAEHQIVKNASYLHHAGARVTLLHRGLQDIQEIVSGLKLSVDDTYRVKSLEDHVSTRRVPKVFRPFFELFIFLQVYSGVRRLLLELGFDLFHVNNGGMPGSPGSLGAAVAGGRAGGRVFMTVNNLAVRHPPLFLLAPYLLPILRRNVSRWITGSAAAAQQLQAALRLPASSVSVIANGVDAPNCKCIEDSFRFAWENNIEGRQLVLSVGHLEARKGHRGLLEVAQYLAHDPRVPENSWVIGIEGLGPLHSSLQKEIIGRGLQDKVVLLGRVPCLYHLYLRARVLCHLSLSFEDLPNVISEAMSLGIPVVAFRVGGTPEQIKHSSTGFLHEIGNYAGVANSLTRLLTDQDLAMKMSKASSARYFLKFRRSIALDNYASLYEM